MPAAKNEPDRQPETGDELPLDYGESRVVLMPVNPFRVHAYWELTPNDRSRANEQVHGESTWVLRFSEVTGDSAAGTTAQGHFDVSIDPSARNRYVDLWSAEKDYIVELGLQSQSGFQEMCRSKPVHVPRADPSPRQEPVWQAEAPTAPQASPFDPHWATVVAGARRPVSRPPPALAGIVGPVVLATFMGDDPEARALPAPPATDPQRALAEVMSADAPATDSLRAGTQLVSVSVSADAAPTQPLRTEAQGVSAELESAFGTVFGTAFGAELRTSHSVSLAGVGSSPGPGRLGLSGESTG